MSTIAPTRSKVSSRRPSRTPSLHRITVDEYERIIGADALEDPSRVELIDGYMVDKMAKKPGHSFSAIATHQALADRLPAGWSARKEEPVRIPAYDEPEPDISVVRGVNADYRQRVPMPADVALLVEVSETTLSQDRGAKRTAYARAGIAVYWIVNLVARQVEVYTRPVKAGRYRSRKVFKAGQQIPVAIAGQPLPPIAVDDILP
jgi:Uma2 family endonuclease